MLGSPSSDFIHKMTINPVELAPIRMETLFDIANAGGVESVALF